MARVKRPKSKARKIIEWILIGIVGTLFLVVGAGQIESMIHKETYFSQPIRFGVGSFVVQTNSMEPEYSVGSAIITYRKDPETIYNDFISGKTVDITFMDRYTATTEYSKPTDKASYYDRTTPTGVPMTHRLREVHVNPNAEKWKGRYTFIVAGINPEGQAAHPGQYQAFTDTYILGVVVLNSNFLGHVFSFVASPWGLFILLLVPAFYLVIVSTLDIFKAMKEPSEAKPAEGPKVESLEGLSDADMKRLKEEMLQKMIADMKKEEKKAPEKKEDDKDGR